MGQLSVHSGVNAPLQTCDLCIESAQARTSGTCDLWAAVSTEAVEGADIRT